jgi:type VI secretion system protein VasG
MQLERVRARAEETYGTQLVFDSALVDNVAERARGTEIGARAVEQMIARELLPLLSRHFLERLGDKQRTVMLRVSLNADGKFILIASSAEGTESNAAPEPTSGATVEVAEAP